MAYDWVVPPSYGVQQTTVMTTTGVVETNLITATEISFYEDALDVIRIVGHVHCRLNTGDGTDRWVRVAQRLRYGIENQVSGAITNAGTNLNDQAVAEERFITEKRFSLYEGASVNTETEFNDLAGWANPWYHLWDAGARNDRMEIPMTLQLTTRLDAFVAGASFALIPWLRVLVRH